MAKLAQQIRIDSSDLLKFAASFDRSGSKTKGAIANAMNAVGEGILTEVIGQLAQTTGFDHNTIRSMIHVHPATSRRLEWNLDASRVIPPSGDWSRPWNRRVNPILDGKQLVKIKTVNDSDVCDFCESIALGSPYTIEQANRMQHRFTGLPGFLHPNCRCVMEPWNSFKAIPVTLGKRKMKNELLTVRQLGKAVKKELKIVMKV